MQNYILQLGLILNTKISNDNFAFFALNTHQISLASISILTKEQENIMKRRHEREKNDKAFSYIVLHLMTYLME